MQHPCRTLRILLAALFLIVGLSAAIPASAGSFKASWKEATKGPQPTNTFCGAWEGKWKSIAHGVSGPLKCVIKDQGNGQYEAYFYAQFHWFHFSYAAHLAVQTDKDGSHLVGEADLGWLGGLYKYSGQATPAKYTSSYQSPHENGVLELERPKSI